MLRILTSLLVLAAIPALACKCELTYPVCQEVRASNLVFIGTVTSTGPVFLDPWHRRDPAAAVPAAEIERLRSDASPVSAAALKSIYLKMLSGLTDGDLRPLREANTLLAVEESFDEIAARNRRAHFKVSTVFRQADDDDKDHEKAAAPKELDVWTPKDDCGIDFQKGETYLVYADNDEEERKLSTSVCYRTKRLSDAGADLAYLNFFRNGGSASSRIEGFVTTERNQDHGFQVTGVDSPFANGVVGLNSPTGVLYTRSGVDGRFIFDGLAGGRYDLSVFSSGFPLEPRLLGGPRTIELAANGCGSPVIAVSPWDATAGSR